MAMNASNSATKKMRRQKQYVHLNFKHVRRNNYDFIRPYKNNDEPFNGTIKSWAKTTCEWTGIHGLAWYNHIDNRVTKLATIILAIVSCIGLPIFLSIELYTYSQNYQVLASG